jgi:outer membrane protein
VKNISIVLNIALIAAVSFLFYKQYSGKKTEVLTTEASTDSIKRVSVQPMAALTDLPKGMPVVFVNADTLFAHYEYAKKAKAATELKVANYQKTYQAKVQAFQKEYNDYMEKAGAGAYTKEQGTAIEEGLQKKKNDIMLMEQNQEKIMGELDNSTVDVQKKIYDFLSRFNKEHGYFCAFAYTRTGGSTLGVNDSLDVTAQVVAGLNAEYNSGKGK